MSLQFYYYFLCPFSRTVKYFLDRNSIEYADRHLDILMGDHISDQYKAINPLQKVPAIREGSFILFESTTILKYLANSKEVDDHWYPKDSKKRGIVDLYLDWHLAHLDDLLLFSAVITGFKKMNLAEAKSKTDEAFAEIENIFLKDRKFLASDSKPTIADIVLVWHLAGIMDTGYEASSKISQYLEDVYNEEPDLLEDIEYYLRHRQIALKGSKVLFPFTTYKDYCSCQTMDVKSLVY